ncbi:hypothetical protein CLAFUW4_01870 [Fulvia fulva]|nr:uncharacterized protein CLAFUR5_20134 [Fulvia fulva]KAK4634527.1 hypothetical protein CLAFUR4_01865 [Fulvia fulva]KAK4637930.1 hypothetical protein CLAFUR0_01867 [Fulvia fulva]WMI38769.1 hypothetical protein CLAFUR5_20134 [Fulvia fulva]WPV08676.1 hypothetical protein CLAFUW4_01870 [Fulvia fulva]WPV25211.1 hypothetical protein CLAFUW7_01869 [Fulvia fulva]
MPYQDDETPVGSMPPPGPRPWSPPDPRNPGDT